MVANPGAAPPTIYYVHTDHLARPVRMTSQTGTIPWWAVYSPFGAVHATGGTPQQDMRFPGQWFQLETGLAYNWNRHYDATLGRYVQPDPIGFEGGRSLYGYVGGNPLAYVDPDGLTPEGRTIGYWTGTWGGRLVGGILGELAEPVGGGAPGALLGGKIGGDVGAELGDWASDQLLGKKCPPEKREPASEKTAKAMADRIEKDLGQRARREFHDAKEGGVGDRTIDELRKDASDIYRDYSGGTKQPPRWMRE